MKFNNTLHSLDLFGIHPTLYFKGQKKSGTCFGFGLSFLLFAFTTLCFFFFGQDLYYQQNPQIRYNEEYDPFPKEINIDPEHSPIMIEINSIFSEFYTNPNLINMNVSQITFKTTENGSVLSRQNYRMEICTKEHFEKLDQSAKEYFLNMRLKDFFCIPKYLKNLTMIGAFDQKLFQTIKFSVSICNNLTNGGLCLPKEEIKRIVSRGYIGIYFVDYNINPGDYANPKQIQPKEVFTNFMISSQREIDIFFKNNYLETDDGLIMKSLSTQIIQNFDSSNVMDLEIEDPDFIGIYFKAKQKNSYYRRSYRKFQEILAQIGGFINCFWIMAFAINYLYSHLIIISETIMNVFTIKLISENENFASSSESEKKFEESNNLLKNNKSLAAPHFFFGRWITTLKNLKIFDKWPKPKHSDKTSQKIETLKMEPLDFFYYYTGLFKSPERERKKIIIGEGEKILKECLDIKFIIQKFYELEKLKEIVLSKEDLKKFAHLPRPELKITLNPNIKKGKKATRTSLIKNKCSSFQKNKNQMGMSFKNDKKIPI